MWLGIGIAVATALCLGWFAKRALGAPPIERQLERLRCVFDQMPDGVVIGDMQGNLLDWNPAALRMHGFADLADVRRHVTRFADMFVFRKGAAVVPFEQWPFNRALRGDIVHGFEADVERIDIGLRLHLRYDVVVLSDASGKPNLIALLIHDRAAEHSAQVERAHSERQLRISQFQLQQFVEHVPAPVAMFDREMRYLHVSRRWVTDYKLGEQWLLGRSHYAVFPEISEEWRAVHRRCLAGEVARSDRDRFARADGSVQWLRWEVRPWHNDEGAVGGIIVFSEDITDRVEAEQRLRAGEQRFRDLVHMLPSAVLVAAAGRIEYSNDAFLRLVGAQRADDVVGRPVTEFLQLPVGAAARAEVPLRRIDGAETPVEAVVVELVDPARRATLCALRDLTERRRADQATDQFHQAQKMESLGRLAGGVAHDFNNLLTVINGTCELLLAAPELAAWSEDLAAVLDAGQRAARLTRQLLEFSRRAVVEPRVIDLHDVVQRSKDVFERLIGEDITLVYELLAARAQVRIDPSQLEQVLLNLLVNARDALPEGGAIVIATTTRMIGDGDAAYQPSPPRGAYVELSIRDNGVGMPPDVMARMFEPFFTTKTPGKGTGLGLPVVLGIVRQNGGFVRVDSAVGIGTTLTILLPVVDEPVQGESVAADGDAQRGTETILLVEDDAAVRSFVHSTLAKHGYQVLEGSRGSAALELLRRGDVRVDLLLTDVVMPDMNGRKLAHSARELRPALPVLFMTGYAEGSVAPHVDGDGDDSIFKPFSATSLLHKIRGVIAAAPK